MKKKGKYKLNKDNKKISIILLENIKKKLFNKSRAFNMLKKGTNTNEPVIGSKIHKSIK